MSEETRGEAKGCGEGGCDCRKIKQINLGGDDDEGGVTSGG